MLLSLCSKAGRVAGLQGVAGMEMRRTIPGPWQAGGAGGGTTGCTGCTGSQQRAAAGSLRGWPATAGSLALHPLHTLFTKAMPTPALKPGPCTQRRACSHLEVAGQAVCLILEA
jgi:hypothetical protein